MQPRAVRIPLLEAAVTFGGHPAILLNISRTGALVRLAKPTTVGMEGVIVITHRGTSIHLEARVMRGDMSSASSAQDGAWHAGIKFVAPPPIEITQLLRRIVSVA